MNQDGNSSASQEPVFSSADNSTPTTNLAGAITSAPDSATNAPAKRARFGGRRFNADASAATPAPVANPNMPDYFNAAMGDVVIANPDTAKKGKGKKIAIIAGAAVAVVGLAVLAIILIPGLFGKSNGGEAKVGETNLDLIFDKTAPILVSENGKFGYVNPENGETIIRPVYDSAERFYGDYAKVMISTGEYAVINRKGEEKLKSVNDDIRYDVKNNIWSTKTDVYTSKLEKINPDNSSASYLGYGYILVIPENGDKKAINQSGIPYIIDSAKKNIYTCENVGCSMVLIKATNNDDVYAAISATNTKSKIIGLKNTQVISEVDSSSYYAKISENILAVKSSKERKIQKYITITNNNVAESATQPEINTQKSLSDSGKYTLAQCNNGFYGINNLKGGAILGCDYEAVVELPANVYAKMLEDKKEPVFLVKNGKVELYDLLNSKTIASYIGYEVIVSNDSPFFQIITDTFKSSVCNVFNGGDCASVDTINVKGYSNYYIANEKYYNYSKKEIR